MLPELRANDLRPSMSGVRAQAVARDGSLVDDFLFRRSGDVLHVLNAPSPAATACLPIGAHIAQELLAPTTAG
jgi:L-2-hydroxyglutarate oxidase